MDIDIQHYRAAIGSFISSNLPYKCFKSRSKRKMKRQNSVFHRIKFLLIPILMFSLAELNSLKVNSASIVAASEKHNLSCWVHEEGGKIDKLKTINIKQTFVKTETSEGGFFYKFSNLGNKYAKYTYGNRKQAGIRIFHFNKGNAHLCNRINEIENIISTHRPSILGLSEGNFYQHHDLDSVQIENYKLINAKTLNNPELKVSRVCVYLHNSMVGRVREDLMDDNFSSIWVEVGLSQKRKILVGNVYREWGFMGQDDPSVSRDISAQKDRWSVFLKQWERALGEDKEVIVLGDMNLNHLEWTRNDLPVNSQTYKLKPLITELFTRILPHGVSQLVTSATWFRPNQPESGLDHLYSNKPTKLSPVQVLNCGGSDHKLIGCTRYSKSIKQNVRYVTKRCYKNFKNVEFISELKKISMWKIYECEDVDLAVKMLSEELTAILDRMAPIRTIQVRENYAPWLSGQTKQIMAERDLAQKIAIQSKSDDDWVIFKRLRNQVNRILKSEKRNWRRAKFKLCEDENDSKQIWKNVKSYLNWTTSGAPTQLFHDGRLENRPIGLAECMNNFFINKIETLRNNLEASEADPHSNLQKLMSNRDCTFKLQPVHPDMVGKLICNLKNSGSVGLDFLDTKIIKLASPEITPALTHIINLSIRQSKFPTQFKKAKVVPLHKRGDVLSPLNYRPVAILPVLSKVLERAVFVQIIDYFEFNKLLHPSHHGFRANHNTTTALLQMYDTWAEAMDKGEATGVCFLDMSAAFDMVNSSVLLRKLHLYGFDFTSITWLESYLTDRKQTVCIDGTCSKMKQLSIGVPQGSVIGPLLYIIFTNDLPESVHGHLPEEQHQHAQGTPHRHSFNLDCFACGTVCCFADDSSYSFSSQSAESISDQLATKYATISDYMGSHELKLNSDKTHLLLIRSDAARRASPDFPVILNTGAEIIQPSKSEKILGATIAQNLKFTEHIQNGEDSMLKALNSRINALKKVSHMASFKTRKAVANGIIISRLIYLIPLWSGCENYLMNALQIVQNKAARLVTKRNKMTPVRTLLKECGWMSVAQLGVYHSLVLVFKILETQSPQYLFNKLSGTQGETYYKTRFIIKQSASHLIKLGPESKASGEIAKNSFKYRATSQWNLLPVYVKEAKNVSIFKNKLRNWIIENVSIK